MITLDRGHGAAVDVDADSVSRVVKMALDTGESPTVAAGYELFRSYRLSVAVGPEVASSPAHQACLLTIVNIARRALLGGVEVVGQLDVPLLIPFPGCSRLSEAVDLLAGRPAREVRPGVPNLILGDAEDAAGRGSPSLVVTFEDWRGGVIPASEGRRLGETTAIIPAAVLAGAIAVSEAFQHLRGNPMAGRRSVGLSLWSPEHRDWEDAPAGPVSIVLPSRLWLIGLGHLGQAYLWTLGLLPYRSPDDVELVLQDFDRLTPANDSTSLLTDSSSIGQPKTRAMARWAEDRGFRTRLVERVFPGGVAIADDEPRLALGGVDNPQARAAYEDAGFDCIIEAGLGAGPTEYLALRLHSFPASTTARAKWGDATASASVPHPRARAYDNLAASGMDECGLVRLASRTVGAPFVGAAAATLVIAEVLRRLNGGPSIEVIDMTLRDPAARSIVLASHAASRFNPGYTV
ncbi:thiamine biosynthesis protein ThiF [Tautonia sociabilis]|uniref:Thiamine biosynthesis protein ThiF n=1 Tax=Tautonia sociabilis TaxID=2080755 RepID=A0A432MCG8_9BACT|nr:thiamine biosynthesis protein ThiF [Tautonia sociabilis]